MKGTCVFIYMAAKLMCQDGWKLVILMANYSLAFFIFYYCYYYQQDISALHLSLIETIYYLVALL